MGGKELLIFAVFAVYTASAQVDTVDVSSFLMDIIFLFL